MEYLDQMRSEAGIHVVRIDDVFNFSKLANTVANVGPVSDSILCLNNDVEVLHRDWLPQMRVWLSDPAAVAVGSQLFYIATVRQSNLRELPSDTGTSVGSILAVRPTNQDLVTRRHRGRSGRCHRGLDASANECLRGSWWIRGIDADRLSGRRVVPEPTRRLGGPIANEAVYPLVSEESAIRALHNAGSGYTMALMVFRWPGLADEVDPYFHPLARIPHLAGPTIIDPNDRLGRLITPRITTTAGQNE